MLLKVENKLKAAILAHLKTLSDKDKFQLIKDMQYVTGTIS